MAISRRRFIQCISVAAVAVSAGWLFWPKSKRKIKGRIMGADSGRGHLLRQGITKIPDTVIHKKVVIAGGGISGLNAGRVLKKQGFEDFILLELADETGGNATSGKNEVSAYPWGAHYLPVPNQNQPDMIDFLKEEGVITGFSEEGLPVYNEYYLCFEPEERLHIKGSWHKSLMPESTMTALEKQELNAFHSLMNTYKNAKGSDGRDAFTIPVAMSSSDEAFTRYDKISMFEFLQEHKWHSPFLHWYVDYCCKDDFGTSLRQTSAWAGIHYFASRKGKGANAESHQMLTWPEGNGWLAKRLRDKIKAHISTGSLVYHIEEIDNKINIDFLDTKTNQYTRVIADAVILATPQYINKKILHESLRKEKAHYDAFSYFPWLVANITVKTANLNADMPLCWDNVMYNSASLGYVNARQQDTASDIKETVITYYLPLQGRTASEARMAAYNKTHENWTALILEDLSKAHPGIEDSISNIDVWLWGHGMIAPVPGFISGETRAMASAPYKNKIFYAHTDLSGISVFEEAFYQGNKAAQELIKSTEA